MSQRSAIKGGGDAFYEPPRCPLLPAFLTFRDASGELTSLVPPIVAEPFTWTIDYYCCVPIAEQDLDERRGGPTSASLSPYGISPSSDPDSTVRSRYCPKPRVIFCRQRASKIQPRSPQLSSPSMEAYSNAITRVERIIIACLDISSLLSIFQSLLSNPLPSYLRYVRIR